MASSPVTVLVRRWPTVVLGAAIGMALAILLSLVQPLKYGATSRLLITLGNPGADAYAASRSAERVAEDLAGLATTDTFFRNVMDGGFDIDRSYFPADAIKVRKAWKKTVEVNVSRATSGLVEIHVFHTNRQQAQEIASAVANAYVTQSWQYVSGGNITVQSVDDPLTSRYPVRPNILQNALTGLFLGALAFAGLLLAREEHARTRRTSS